MNATNDDDHWWVIDDYNDFHDVGDPPPPETGHIAGDGWEAGERNGGDFRVKKSNILQEIFFLSFQQYYLSPPKPFM